MYKKIFLIISLLGISFGNVELSFGEYNYSSNSIPVYYNSDSDIYGFQFVSNQNSDVLILGGASGGIAEEYGFSVTSSSNTGVVLGFDFMGLSSDTFYITIKVYVREVSVFIHPSDTITFD